MRSVERVEIEKSELEEVRNGNRSFTAAEQR
jgi:hypothetical protein